ncbi:MAG: aldo/keto reductase [Clostridiales Family XIII bacterium]|jgi:predicted oxidoreductase|nr:aldo/keto reductase [Clostridiales Family XIII bacterium]
MRKQKLGVSELETPVIGVGCWRINTLSTAEAEVFVQTALDEGAYFFDHADIYNDGLSESIFAEAVHMNDNIREKLIIQSKCGIHPGKMFDFSKAHILEAVDGSLKRLKTDYLDVLLLHRPDALVEPEEVAEAFDILQSSGKVRNFGVSNQTPMQIKLLKKCVKQPIIVNQLELSITNATMISRGIHVNMDDSFAVDRDGDILDFCRLSDITVQAWSPFQYGFFEGVFIGNPKFPELNAKLDEVGAKYGVNSTTIAIAWILRHPAKIIPLTGTMNIGRLKDCIKAADVNISREEWYEIFLAAGNILP